MLLSLVVRRREECGGTKEMVSRAGQQRGIHLDVSPPGTEAWQELLLWSDIVRVCYKVEGYGMSSGWYFFTKQRPESYAVPVDADGGEVLLDELQRRKLFDSELAIQAATALEGLFCSPPIEANPAKLRSQQVKQSWWRFW